MLTGNIEYLLLAIVLIMAYTQLKEPIYRLYRKVKAWWINRKLLTDQAKVNVFVMQPDRLYEGYGFIKNKKIVTKDRQPLIFSDQDRAWAFAEREKLEDVKLIYQVWNPIEKTVNIGEVISVEEFQQNHA